MPEVKVLSCEVDNNGFELWDETKSAFTNITLNETNDEIGKMKETATQDSINNGLLTNAKTNAETMLKSFIEQAFDSSEYKIEFVY